MLLGLILLTFRLDAKEEKRDTTYLQLALLLDVSNSMEGLLSQAQNQIWGLINYLNNFSYQEDV